MTESLMGIDLGTSSVKVLIRGADGTVKIEKEAYKQTSIFGWLDALSCALSRIDCSSVVGIGLSSQVGTFVVNERDVIPWDSPAAQQELAEIREKYSTERFVEEICMPHPKIVSYPIPRLLYIKRNFGSLNSVCQPKDMLYKFLTGVSATDPYSWRGLCNTQKGRYSSFFLNELGIDEKILPPIYKINESARPLCAEVATRFGFSPSVSVYLGLNDFYCALLGMGIKGRGDAFDITGTSEHFGIIEQKLSFKTPLVSSEFFGSFVHYGVTAASGSALRFADETFKVAASFENLSYSPPIFTPYLRGERAPIFDSLAQGAFFGIREGCSESDMAYSVREGIAFSLYHIYEKMGKPKINRIIGSGGATHDILLCNLKAELFGVPFIVSGEKECSALGALMVAAEGSGIDGIAASAAAVYSPTGKYREKLLKRYEVYKALYPALKNQYKNFLEANK